ncbi:abortive infection family protein [Clostridium sporogenes]|uniref:abortive infection family protein n=1 Tax=Clostridium sporogenes TaxID=1509 RepID=UPI0013D32A4B|nr:abortive infection family protein [Clostridium sporogenes]
MSLTDIFNVFSKRNKDKENKDIIINITTRNRILMILKKPRTNSLCYSFKEVLLEVREMLLLKLGVFNLTNKSNNELEDIAIFIKDCKGEQFLDFLEYIFKAKSMNIFTGEKIIEDINFIFLNDNIEFRLTKYVTEEHKDEISTFIKIRSYPQIINEKNNFIYSEITSHTLDLLNDERFINANKEFLEGLEHYKKNRYKECITSCCSSLESTIKVICEIKKWKYEKDTLSGLVRFVEEKSAIPSCFENVLISTGTIRNKLGSSHGKGKEEITTNKSQAKYQINITASNIIFLVEEILS